MEEPAFMNIVLEYIYIYICVYIHVNIKKKYEMFMNTAHILINQYVYNSYKLPSIVMCLLLKELL
jgi:hypothetical protein